MKTYKNIRFDSGGNFQLEINTGLATISSAEKEELVKNMREVTSKSWNDFKEVTYRWLELADILFFVKQNDKLIAFSSNKYFSDDLIIFLSTMVLPEYQNLGIAKRLQRIAVGYFVREQVFINGLKFWKNFSTLYFAYRTPNPRAVIGASKHIITSPVYGSKPSEKEMSMAKTVADIFSPTCHFDLEHFVIEGAFTDSPELIYEEQAIPWSGNSKVDAYCAKYLDYRNKKGNLLVIVGKINPLFKITLFFT